MAEEEKINVEFLKPEFSIGQAVYIPQKNWAREANIVGYEVRVRGEGGNLFGIIVGFHIPSYVSVRRGGDSIMVSEVTRRDFYVSKKEAEEASRFLEVKVDDETWKLAIGDREVDKDSPDSPYSLENCGLSRCCPNISNARDILLYCKRNSGLIAHDRNELSDLISSCGNLEYEDGSPIARIFEQLEID